MSLKRLQKCGKWQGPGHMSGVVRNQMEECFVSRFCLVQIAWTSSFDCKHPRATESNS